MFLKFKFLRISTFFLSGMRPLGKNITRRLSFRILITDSVWPGVIMSILCPRELRDFARLYAKVEYPPIVGK